MANNILEELVSKYPSLAECLSDIQKAYDLLCMTYEHGGRVFVAGNGGSSCDAEHIVGELLKSFKKRRPIKKEIYDKLYSLEDGKILCGMLEGALPAYSLNSQTGIMTAFANDKMWDGVFAQQLYGLGNEGDCLILLSTSGNSNNCVYAALTARAIGISTISLTGMGGGKLNCISDCNIAVPESETYKVQELHLPIYHALCAMLEERFFSQ